MKKQIIYYLLLSVFVFGCNATGQGDQSAPFALVIHGGAGTIKKENMTPEMEAKYREKLAESLEAGYQILSGGGSSQDAIVAAIRVLEDSPFFNAGKGAVFTAEGKNELDASFMDGATLNAGAVAGVTTIKNPVEAARAVMEHSEHVFLTGKGAETFAQLQGIETVEPDYFFSENRYEQLKKIKEAEEKQEKPDHEANLFDPFIKDSKFGTVGAVALDMQGNIAAATSTGGMTNKKFGRVGDAPIIGAGTYANNKTCGVSSTGHGEYFIRGMVAYDISALMEYRGLSLEDASNLVVMDKLTALGGTGGVICLDKQGNVSMPFNTSGMYRGYIKKDGQAKVFIYQNEE